MTKTQITKGFNKWMRDYIKNPKKFEKMYIAKKRFLSEKSKGKTPSYGAVCAEVLSVYSR